MHALVLERSLVAMGLVVKWLLLLLLLLHVNVPLHSSVNLVIGRHCSSRKRGNGG